METLEKTLAATAAVYALIAVGWALARRGMLDDAFAARGTRLVVALLYPCLMLRFILGNAALRNPANVWLPPLLGFAFIAVGLVVARACARYCRLGDAMQQRTFAFVTAVNNYGYVPIPLCAALFDTETVGVLLVFNLGVEAALWTFGPIVIPGKKFDRKNLARLLNPVLISLFAGLALNAVGALERLPDVLALSVRGFLQIAGDAAIPLALLLIGATLHSILKNFGFRPEWRTIAWGCVLRLGVLPALLFACVFLLPTPPELRRVVIVQCAMPCAVFPILMSLHYGGRPAVAVQVVLATSLVAFATMPLWLFLGNYCL